MKTKYVFCYGKESFSSFERLSFLKEYLGKNKAACENPVKTNGIKNFYEILMKYRKYISLICLYLQNMK